ncbi:MAG: DUF1648 domain-containing protein [Mobilitalea sp.]
MKKTKLKILSIVSIIYIILTGVINAYGYFHLPKIMATQFSFSGEKVNMMSKSTYLLIGFAAVFVLSVFCLRNEKEKKIKYFLIDSLIVIANIMMIVSQL